jgi:UDP-2-acetamido-2-deoxy-ribo-hexuluronate aminotransferase
MDLLIDVNIALDVCARREPFYGPVRDAIQLCKYQGGRLWLYVGAVQTLEYNLVSELRRVYSTKDFAPTNRQVHARCQALLQDFCADKHWLTALAGEGPVFDSPDPEDEQLIRALGPLCSR